MKPKIGIFDSGSGGRTTMAAIQEALPDAEIRYYADLEHLPYGGKTPEELLAIARPLVEDFLGWGADIIVIACNTMTVNCINQLRLEYPEAKFVGTEPALKLAASSGYRKVLLMATEATAKNPHVQVLAEEISSEVITLACPGLAEAIEHSADTDSLLNRLLSSVDSDIDAVVLGCTHYVWLSEAISAHFPGATIIDGNAGVAARVKALLSA